MATDSIFRKNWVLETHVLQKVSELWAHPTPPCDHARFQQALESERPAPQSCADRGTVSNGFTREPNYFFWRSWYWENLHSGCVYANVGSFA